METHCRIPMEYSQIQPGEVWKLSRGGASESGNRALRALGHLWERVGKELQAYRAHVVEAGDQARRDLADWVACWLPAEGLEIRNEIACKIRLAAPTDQARMETTLSHRVTRGQIQGLSGAVLMETYNQFERHEASHP